MNKEIKILIIGFGSIGQRHYRNLQKLGLKEVYVYDVDKKQTDKPGVKSVSSLTEKVLKDFDVSFVCNPSSLHIKTAMLCARVGCHLFIEKPLSHNLRGIKELEAVCRRKKLITMVACNMRFHSGLKFIKKYIDGGKLGSIYNIALETGYYLPYWRPNQDYTKGYAAKKSSGGGIILDGGIHNFDLMFWLNDFTGVERTEIVHNKASDLKIETEDNFLSILKFKNKVLGLVKGDYLQQSYSWTCKVVGSKGNLRWDFVSNTVYIDTKKGSRKLLQKTKYDANEMYVEQLRYFLSCINQRKQTFNSVKISAEVLKHCLKR